MHHATTPVSRHRFMQYGGTVGLLAGLNRLAPVYAWQQTAVVASTGGSQGAQSFDLLIRRETIPIAGGVGHAMTINGSGGRKL